MAACRGTKGTAHDADQCLDSVQKKQQLKVFTLARDNDVLAFLFVSFRPGPNSQAACHQEGHTGYKPHDKRVVHNREIR